MNGEKEEFSRFLYEQAVRGYEFNINRYKDWMNLYAIFVGAFFIAYYTLIDKVNILSLIIILLGFVTSFCWLFSFYGYYNWQKSWVQILHYHESPFLEDTNIQVDDKNKYRVYSVAIDNGKLYSSQKIIKIFLNTVIAGWSILLIKDLFFLIINNCCCNIYITNNCIYQNLCPCICIILFLILFLILIICWLKKEISKKILSDIDNMDKLEKIKLDEKESVYRVIKPKEEIVVNEKEANINK